MSLRELVTQEINALGELELQQVAEYMSFLKFQARRKAKPSLDETELAALYAEFAEEDRALAESGMADYANGLAAEDTE